MAQRHKKIEPRRIRPDADVANSAGKKKMKRKKNNIEGASCRTWTVRIIGVSSMTRRTTHGCREERRIRVRPKKGERITHPRIPTRDNACHIETIPATAVSIWPKNGFWSARRNFRIVGILQEPEEIMNISCLDRMMVQNANPRAWRLLSR